MTTDNSKQLQEKLAKLQKMIANRQAELNEVVDILKPEAYQQQETALLQLRQQAADITAQLSGHGAISQGSGDAVAATGVVDGVVSPGHDNVTVEDSDIEAGERAMVGVRAKGHVITGDGNKLISTIINLYRQGDPQQTDEATLRRQIADYLRGLYNRYSRLELRGIRRDGQQVIQLELEQVYVPLAAKTWRRGGQSEEIRLDQVLQRGQRVIITGGPGSGKTTVLLHLAATLALALGSDTPALAAEKLGLTGPLPLPVYIPLSSYARYRRTLPDGYSAEQDTLAAFISHYLIRRGQGGFDLPEDFFQQLLRSGRQVMALLDGLDEVPGENERVKVREAIEGLLDSRPKLQIVATCRTAAYVGQSVLGRGFREVAALPLREGYIVRLVKQAYGLPDVFGSEPGQAEAKSNDLLKAISDLEEQRRRLYGEKTEPLITSPLLVRMLMIVHISDRRLPEQRAELYKKATDNLLLPEYQPDQEVAYELGGLVGGSQSVHREMAQYLAFELHQRGDKQGRELEEYELRQILQTHPTYPELAEDFIGLTRRRSTLLEERDGQYRFIHLAFQEFLVASYLADVKMGEGGYNAIAGFLEQGPLLDSWWREPILLISGYFSIDKPQAAQKLLQRLAGLDEHAPARAATLPAEILLGAAELAAAAALEWPGLPAGLKAELAARLTGFFTKPGGLDNTPPVLRAEAGNILARLGDPRPEVTTVDAMQFCYVPAGSFEMGSGDDDDLAYNDEMPQHTFNIEYGYWLARYPVTIAQWQEFVTDSGHKPEEADSLRDPANRPVRYVTWYEAVKFCEWLSKRWQANGLLPAGWQVRLPSEAEWEKGARGGLEIPTAPVIRVLSNIESTGSGAGEEQRANPGPRRRYPWGDKAEPNRANYDATGIRTTSAVGCFPDGVTVYGCEEMSGNVLEWCVTRQQDSYEYYRNDNAISKTNVRRILRGGAFYDNVRYVRCAVRFDHYPASSYRSLGFRVMCVAPI